MSILTALVFAAALYCTLDVVASMLNCYVFKRTQSLTAIALATCALWGLFYWLTH